MVKINDELVEELLEDHNRREEEKKQQQAFLFNNEHVGMDDEELRKFLLATRLKTVEYI